PMPAPKTPPTSAIPNPHPSITTRPSPNAGIAPTTAPAMVRPIQLFSTEMGSRAAPFSPSPCTGRGLGGGVRNTYHCATPRQTPANAPPIHSTGVDKLHVLKYSPADHPTTFASVHRSKKLARSFARKTFPAPRK